MDLLMTPDILKTGSLSSREDLWGAKLTPYTLHYPSRDTLSLPSQAPLINYVLPHSRSLPVSTAEPFTTQRPLLSAECLWLRANTCSSLSTPIDLMTQPFPQVCGQSPFFPVPTSRVRLCLVLSRLLSFCPRSLFSTASVLHFCLLSYLCFAFPLWLREC